MKTRAILGSSALLLLAACGNKSEGAEGAAPGTAPAAQAAQAAPAVAANPTTIAPGQTQTLSLSALPTLNFVVTEAGSYTIDVDGAGRDPVVTIYNGDQAVARDDDGGEERNARLTHELQPGSYRVVVLEYAGRAMVARVTATRSDAAAAGGKNPPGAPAAAAPAAPAIAGTLALGVPQTLTVAETPALALTLTEPTHVRLDVSGGDEDPVAAIFNGDQLIERDDDGGDNLNSRITQRLQPGAYRIVVLEYKGHAMRAQIAASVVAPPPTAATIAGTGETLVVTRNGGSSEESAVDVALNITTAGSYVIDAIPQSSEHDPKIELLRDGTVVADDDDGGGDHAARLTQTLTPGTYTIRVMSFNGSAIGVRVKSTAAGGK
jgi:hypothetical protein